MYPVLINTSIFTLHSYGVMVALAFGLAIFYCYKNVKKSGLDISGDQILSIATFLIIFSMLGARWFYVIQFWKDFNYDWLAIFLFKQREGFVFYGGLLTGTVYLVWYTWHYKINFWKFMDYVIPAGALGYGIGRLGCFLNGCCYGRPTSVPWAVVFPHHPGEWRHPTQIYEALFGLVLFFILKYWQEQKTQFSGQVFLLGIIAYAVERFLVELLRINPLYGPFSQAQWISIILFLLSSYFYWQRAKEKSI
ncbi:MAG: prolipoprotein diacylglyceryl transferase [Candidatus Margulisbacteria bacterium]|nr:prolipoprotein diacylglyceryl transferase [Candidatus Margulisiibacteriota bacterium]